MKNLLWLAWLARVVIGAIVIAAWFTLVAFAFFFATGCSSSRPAPMPTPKCSADGGYQWCASIQKCIRQWETKCPPCEHAAPPKNCRWTQDASGDCTKDKLACPKPPHESLWMRFKCWLFGDTCSVRGLFI